MTADRRVLVVGASGVLGPAATILASRDWRVTGVARNRRLPDGVEALFVDAAQRERLEKALAGRRWDAAIVYAPALSDASLDVVRAAVDGAVVEVRVSAAADPALGEFVVLPNVLQLGWRAEADGSTAWHDAAEISAAAVAVLDDGRGRVLGAVRPWEHRP
ncbi:hypothetical protein [Leifsonia sp. Leaf264]|uniref:hypothetical protein n=1 Tax=Leifsonia sp. Leaf264 TaxID=1736314 RepID=UPI000AA4C8EF|nr:hypothetical protein [Leifsonia sp. Leaf264]